MDELKNDFKTYVFYQNDKIITKQSKSVDDFFSTISQEKINNIVDFTFLNYTELKISKEKSEYDIEEIKNLNDPINFLINNLKADIIQYYCDKGSNNSSSISKSQLNIKYKIMEINLKYLSKILAKKSDNSVIYNENDLYIKLNNSFLNIQEEISSPNLNDFSDNIDDISQCSKLIIEIFNILQIFHYKILSFIVNFLKLYDMFYENQKSANNLNFSLNSCLINQNQDLIIVFDQITQVKNPALSEIKQIFLSILEKYKKNVIFSEENDQNDIQKYFNAEVLLFIQEITTVITAEYSTFSDFIEKVSTFQTKYEIKTNKTATDLIFDRTKTDFFWQILQKYQISCKATAIIDAIFEFYKNFIGISVKKQIYDEFISIYSDRNETAHELSAQLMMNQIVKEIQQKGQFFYMKILNELFFKNLINEDFFITKIDNFFPKNVENSNDENSYEYHYKNIGSGYFASSAFSSHFWYDKKFHFFLQIIYNADVKKDQQHRETSIFGKNYSKFIVHTVDTIDDNKIIIPYFPGHSLNDILMHSKRRIELTYVDKIMIFLEIATALNDLHQNGEYHGNLNSHSILMNSKKDVYLACFSVERYSKYDSTPKDNYYFIPPELINKDQNKDEEKDEDFIRNSQKGDIYSFGVLMYTVITEKEPDFLFAGKTRKERLNILNNGYVDFLFTKEESQNFFNENGYLTDDMGNCWIGMKEIIEKCMKKNPDERFSSIRDVIDSIKELLIYSRNKEEIEYRFEKAASSSEYFCTFSDIIECYYLGQERCITDIKDILTNYRNSLSSADDEVQITDDIIKTVFELFEIKKIDDFHFIFDDIFDSIIQLYLAENVGNNHIIDTRNKLLSLSIEYALNQKNSIVNDLDFIMPVSTINNFIENKQFFENYSKLKWVFFLANELSFVHSKGMFHGNLSSSKIGVYFNYKLKIFFPSIILFHSYSNHINQIKEMNESMDFSKCSKYEILVHFQSKDIKSFIKIVKKFDVVSDEHFNEIEKMDSMNRIVLFLYNYILGVNKELLNDDFTLENYLSFSQITFFSIQNIFTFCKDYNFTLENLTLNIENILDLINEFLENTLAHPSQPLIENILKGTIKNQTKSEINTIDEKFEKISSNCSSICAFILDKLEIKIEEILTTEGDQLIIQRKKPKSKAKKVEKFDFPKFKSIQITRNKNKKWLENAIERKINFHELYKRSVLFLVKRYILSLHPFYKYKMIVKIQNRTFSEYQDTKLKAEDIIEAANDLGHTDILVVNGDVIIYIHPKKS